MEDWRYFWICNITCFIFNKWEKWIFFAAEIALISLPGTDFLGKGAQ